MPASEVEILGEGPFEVARSKPRLCQGRKVSVDDFFHGPNLVELIFRHHETILWFIFPFIAGEICEDLDFFEIIFRDLNLHRYLRYESPNLSQHAKNPETQDDFSKQNWQQNKADNRKFQATPTTTKHLSLQGGCSSMSSVHVQFCCHNFRTHFERILRQRYVTMQMVAWQKGFCLPTWGTTMLKLYMAYYGALHCSLFVFFQQKFSGSQIQNDYGSCINIVVLAVGQTLVVVLVDG